jgi:hypothetical protein
MRPLVAWINEIEQQLQLSSDEKPVCGRELIVSANCFFDDWILGLTGQSISVGYAPEGL